MVATNCREALLRVREAAQGSPLIDSEQNKKLLFDAIAQAERLCLGDDAASPGKADVILQKTMR